MLEKKKLFLKCSLVVWCEFNEWGEKGENKQKLNENKIICSQSIENNFWCRKCWFVNLINQWKVLSTFKLKIYMFKHLWNQQYIKFNEIIFGAYFDSLVLLLDIVIIQIHGLDVRGGIFIFKFIWTWTPTNSEGNLYQCIKKETKITGGPGIEWYVSLKPSWYMTIGQSENACIFRASWAKPRFISSNQGKAQCNALSFDKEYSYPKTKMYVSKIWNSMCKPAFMNIS